MNQETHEKWLELQQSATTAFELPMEMLTNAAFVTGGIGILGIVLWGILGPFFRARNDHRHRGAPWRD